MNTSSVLGMGRADSSPRGCPCQQAGTLWMDLGTLLLSCQGCSVVQVIMFSRIPPCLISISALPRCCIMWKMSQRLSSISTASWKHRQSSSSSWCQVRAAPQHTQWGKSRGHFWGLREFSTGWPENNMYFWFKYPFIAYRVNGAHSSTAMETCISSISAQLCAAGWKAEDCEAVNPCHGH